MKKELNLVLTKEKADSFRDTVIYAVKPFKTARECISLIDAMEVFFQKHPSIEELPNVFGLFNMDVSELAIWETLHRVFHIEKSQIQIFDIPILNLGKNLTIVKW